MAAPQLEKSRLRDLILAYYTKNDPTRLQDGIDINGMVNWTMEKGLGALNSMLQKSYGEVIDINEKIDFNSPEHQNRVSMAVSGRFMMDLNEMKKIKIAEELKRFYKKYDPSKLPSIFKLTEYALYKGENALNSKLRMKYGADLRTFDQDDDDNSSQSTLDIIPPLIATVNNVAKPVLEPEPVVEEEPVVVKVEEEVPAFAPPPPPLELVEEEKEEEKDLIEELENTSMHDKESKDEPRLSILEEDIDEVLKPETETPPQPIQEEEVQEEKEGILEALEEDKEKLQAELLRFYKTHDPDKVVVLDALVLWALQLGRKGYNEKLVQLYGADLDTPVEGEKPKPVDIKEEPSRKERRINKPIKTKQNIIQRIIGQDKPSFLSFEAAATATAKKADPLKGPNLYREFMEGDGEPCGNYKIDMTSPLFGMCVCGHTKKACMSYGS